MSWGAFSHSERSNQACEKDRNDMISPATQQAGLLRSVNIMSEL